MPPPSRDTTISILVIGDEILAGKKVETNAQFLIREFRDLGARLRSVVVISDDPDEITHWVALLKDRSDYLITSGGVGPTHDDRTVPCIAAALGRRLVRHPELEQAIRRLYPGPITDEVLEMADLPEGTEFIHAPGLSVPCVRIENILIFPGEPEIFRKKFTAIKEMFRTTPYAVSGIRVAVDEGAIATLLKVTESRFPGVSIGSYPETDESGSTVLITLESKDPVKVRAALACLREGLDTKWVVDFTEGSPPS